jgi:hypothetical protein
MGCGSDGASDGRVERRRAGRRGPVRNDATPRAGRTGAAGSSRDDKGVGAPVRAGSDAALFRSLNETVPTIPGIVSTETSYVLATGKINYDWRLPSDVGQRRPGEPTERG